MADQWASAPELHGELAEAEAVAAKLVEVICQQEGDLRNATWEMGVLYEMLDNQGDEHVGLREAAERTLTERDAARAEVRALLTIRATLEGEIARLASEVAALGERTAALIEEYGGPPQCDCGVCRYCYWSRAIEGAARIARDEGVKR